MPALLKFLKRSKILVGFIVFLIISYAIYFWIYFTPITNNAFVMANYQPVSAQISGRVKHIHVDNGQQVKKGQTLFTLEDQAYKTHLSLLKQKLASQQIDLKLLKKQLSSLTSQKRTDKNSKTDDIWFNNKKQSLQLQIAKQKAIIEQTVIQLKQAQDTLSKTEITAPADGVISNLFLTEGATIKAYQPLFSFIDTSQWWVQANFKENDIPSGLKPGDKATIRLKMYLGEKVYKGVVTSTNWAVYRQHVNERSQMQQVPPENQWILLPQRFPVMIKILNPDPQYPLNVGASAYVTLEK